MSSADVKPKKLKKSKGAFGKDGSDPRAAPSSEVAAPPTPAAEEAAPVAKKEKKDKKRKAEEAAPVAESSSAAAVDDEAAKKEKKRLKKEKKAAAAAASSSATPTGLPTPAHTPAATPGPSTLSAESLAYLAEHKITVSAPYTPLVDMTKLPIDPKLVPALKEFAKPTPIQACSWPALFAGKDVVGVAETGSGKTLGFGVRSPRSPGPSRPRLSCDTPEMRILTCGSPCSPDPCHAAPTVSPPVVCATVCAVAFDPDCVPYPRAGPPDVGHPHHPLHPPRIQVGLPLRRYAQARAGRSSQAGRPQGRCRNARTSARPRQRQGRQLREVSTQQTTVVRATRIGSGTKLTIRPALLSFRVTYLVLDEADRMLDKGFENDIRAIIGQCPVAGRQTLMCQYSTNLRVNHSLKKHAC